ncbi:hypothetical protein PsasTeo6_23144 [Pseudomonas asiatica]|nr:hypothetical protein PsasTeo6_23144 [Pseudomonas asiatica]
MPRLVTGKQLFTPCRQVTFCQRLSKQADIVRDVTCNFGIRSETKHLLEGKLSKHGYISFVIWFLIANPLQRFKIAYPSIVKRWLLSAMEQVLPIFDARSQGFKKALAMNEMRERYQILQSIPLHPGNRAAGKGMGLNQPH